MKPPLIPIAFALTPRMQSYLELRDTLRCMDQAYQARSPYAWLTAVKELHDLLMGEANKRPAMLSVLGLFSAMKKHFNGLIEQHPRFETKLLQACNSIDEHEDNIRRDLPVAIDFICTDAWLTSYYDIVRKQDLLGHKQCLPQVIHHIWATNDHHGHRLNHILASLQDAIKYLDQMLHAHVPWQPRVVKCGTDQITLNKQDEIELLIIGLPKNIVQQGIFPQYAGSRQLVRLRFNQSLPGQPIKSSTHDFDYSIMLVPMS
ncbi:MAG: hypothetical protein R8M45_03060 [Ghiorsea sp.]